MSGPREVQEPTAFSIQIRHSLFVDTGSQLYSCTVLIILNRSIHATWRGALRAEDSALPIVCVSLCRRTLTGTGQIECAQDVCDLLGESEVLRRGLYPAQIAKRGEVDLEARAQVSEVDVAAFISGHDAFAAADAVLAVTAAAESSDDALLAHLLH